MPKKLPSVQGRDVVRALQRAGFEVDRQRGSHVILWHPIKRRAVSVPVHKGRDVKRGTLRGILHDADLTVEEFLDLLK